MLSDLLVTTPMFLSVSALPCLALLDLLKTVDLSLYSSSFSSFLPTVCTVTVCLPVWEVFVLCKKGN